jgi:hypothetical protein
MSNRPSETHARGLLNLSDELTRIAWNTQQATDWSTDESTQESFRTQAACRQAATILMRLANGQINEASLTSLLRDVRKGAYS